MIDMNQVSDATRMALAHLRDPIGFQWTIVFVLGLAFYIYASEIQAGRWNVVAAGFAVWFADWINELLNCAILQLTGKAPLWAETGSTSYQILVGINVETSFLFLILGLVYAKMLPADRNMRIFGINNRIVLALVLSTISTAVELVLNAFGVLNWYWPFWDKPWGIPLIVIFGYGWFFLAAAWAYDAATGAQRWRRVATLAAIAGILAVVFGGMGWL